MEGPKLDIDSCCALIEDAFRDTPNPGPTSTDISRTAADEGVGDCFAGTSWRDHSVAQLRYHEVALVYFKDEAFRYWLPAFMLAELKDPANTNMAWDLIVARLCNNESAALLSTFSKMERLAIISFLEICNERYKSDSRSEDAISNVRTSLVLSDFVAFGCPSVHPDN
ncbi:MAG: hypothetical protein JWP89_7011 [Schlesneria sp.]|nr:hypothetical protein [Schlesneria sp.]